MEISREIDRLEVQICVVQDICLAAIILVGIAVRAYAKVYPRQSRPARLEAQAKRAGLDADAPLAVIGVRGAGKCNYQRKCASYVLENIHISPVCPNEFVPEQRKRVSQHVLCGTSHDGDIE